MGESAQIENWINWKWKIMSVKNCKSSEHVTHRSVFVTLQTHRENNIVVGTGLGSSHVSVESKM